VRNKLTAFLLLAVAFSAGAAEPDFAARRALVTEARLDEAFDAVAVKADRVMPWSTFVANRYRLFCGDGDPSDGDLGNDAGVAIWLAILDGEYRRTGRVLFVEGDSVPGVNADRWISLREFETDLMPVIIGSPGSFDGGETEVAVKELVNRAGILHRLSWEELLVVPGSPEAGWQPVTELNPARSHIERINQAYAAGNAADIHRNAASLAAALVSQPGYPSAAKLGLEKYLDRFAVLKIGFALYVLSALLFFVWWAVGKRRIADAGAWVALAGFVFMTVGLVGRSIIAGHLPTTGMYEYIVLLSWTAVLFFLLFYVKTRGAFLGVIVMPVAFLLIVVSSLFPSDIETQLIPALQSWWLTIHVVLACLAEGAFAVAFAAAFLRLVRSDKPGGRLPSKDRLEDIEYRAVALGYPLFTIGALVAGAIWAQKAWSVWWNWDPKETASLVVFLIATAYLHARRARGWRGTRTAALAILIFVAAVFTLFANLIFGGLHSYGL
jgi:cytochrome c-type biogenesis protein CcsB